MDAVSQHQQSELFPEPLFTCDNCGEERPDNVVYHCEHCDQCESCCECYTCDECDARVNPNDRYSSPQCSNCDRCGDCCNCFECSGCNSLNTSDDRCDTCEQCESCCDCWRCRGCRERYTRDGDTYQCSNCDECDNCCTCSVCDRCGDRMEHLCDRCNGADDRCSECCTCVEDDDDDNDDETVSARSTRSGWRPSGLLTNGYLTFHDSETFDRNKSRRYVSLELEVAKDDRTSKDKVTPVAIDWNDSIVKDGSLPDGGFEINLNPTNGDKVFEHIGAICNGLASASAVVDKSCGMHCHVDVRDYDDSQLFNLCRLYARVEEALFSLVSRSRRANDYCTRVHGHYYFERNDDTFMERLEERLYSGSNSEKRNKYASARYYALNLHSVFYRKTVEFRHHQGTTNPTKAANWALICTAIVDSAASMTTDEIDALSRDSFECLMSILPTDALRDYCSSRREALA